MAQYETGYQALGTYDDDEEEDTELPLHETGVMIHQVPSSNNARWNHIKNLDDFFTRVYHFHQRNGFVCMVLEDILQLVQFVFVVLFTTFLVVFVDYGVLFDTHSAKKVTIPEVILPMSKAGERFHFGLVLCLLVATVFWLLRVVKVIYNIFKYFEINTFYKGALKISTSDLANMTWHEVQRRVLEVQKEQHMCIHKRNLTELDIYHRILRFKNYMIAMVNKSLLPLEGNIPFVGTCSFLSIGLKYNIEIILFWGPWSPFENNWKLRDEYKNMHNRKRLAEQLAKRILWIGIANFILCPVIFLWQILYSFFRYAELIKREPGALGVRRWSNYGRLYLRHFNELDHEFTARLNRGYKPATMYMNIFTTPVLVVLAKNVAFFMGSILAVLVVLTVIDEDVLTVEHVLTTMTITGVIVTCCRALIPDEHTVYNPEHLLTGILAQIHYMPEHWKGNAHTLKVRNEFGQLFEYKFTYLCEELLSPFITPFILCFGLRNKALDIVDFFRNFTVDVVGVGDVCSFAQMDIRKHGNPQWVVNEETQADSDHQGEDGKIELSLMHFHLTNPEWRPPENCSMFLHNLKEQAHRDASTMSAMPGDNPLFNSFYSLGQPGYRYSSMSSVALQSCLSPSFGGSLAPPVTQTRPQFNVRGAVSHTEGPLGSSSGILGSLHTSGSLQGSLIGPSPSNIHIDEGTIEMLSNDMSFSALYMHEMRHRRSRGVVEQLEDLHARALWQQRPESLPHISTVQPHMPGIKETPQEEESDGCVEDLSGRHDQSSKSQPS
ncbi:autophagy-related protein 9A-like [Liolophura sinensis]|uniref:autophagy-related protein 9A-like n=1 Tax=Liolophura sinensis TaxID=3198878 RepID=UPI003158B28C